MISDCMRQFKSRSKVFFFYSRKRNIILTTTARLCFFCILSLSDCARNTIHKCLVKYFNQTMSTYIYINIITVWTDRASRYRTEKRGEKKETLLWKGKENFSLLKLTLMITRRTSKFVNVITRGGKMAMIIDKLYWRRGSHIYM